MFPSEKLLIRFFFASSMPLRIASGTSEALPKPKPTMPLPSPTTTRAANLKIRPPLTVLDTRLMATTFSCKSSVDASILAKSIPPRLEFEAALASTLCQLFDTAVINITAAVKNDFGNALFHAPFCQSSADLAVQLLCCRRMPSNSLSIVDAAAKRNAVHIVNKLGVDVFCGAEYIQARTLRCAADFSTNSRDVF